MSEAVAQRLPEAGSSRFIFTLGIPLLLAFVIHGIALLALVEGWSVTDVSRSTPRIDAINARLIQLEAKAPPASTPVVARSVPAPVPQSIRPALEARPARSEPVPLPAPQTTRSTDFEDNALRELLDRSLEDAITSEAEQLASQRSEAAVASYVGAIVRRIEQNWSRPPSARNGMRAELLIGLVPGGELVSVEVVASSGNSAFDRSAQVAVRDAAPFEVPEDPVLFERGFRNLRILFRPEDLRN